MANPERSRATADEKGGLKRNWCSVFYVIPALVAGIQRKAGSEASGWLDAGDKPRHDREESSPCCATAVRRHRVSG
jgi:hypothetical protein